MSASSPHANGDPIGPPPSEWHGVLTSRLEAGEHVVAWFLPDLDDGLNFKESLVVLTEGRLIHADLAGPADRGEWSLLDRPRLVLRERSVVGTLELFDKEGRLARWRFTPSRHSAAYQFKQKFERVSKGKPEERPEGSEGKCASCGAPAPEGSTSCTACAMPAGARNATGLLRLARFTSPRAGVILAGLALTLASTAVGLIPPFLTVPLLNNVLVPRRDFYLVKWYLLGLAGASVLTWLLSWARTYVVAWVSERIAADLRLTTYEHLQRLSLEYFGGRRTGDLISRLSSDTDRICTFISVNLLDFVTDVVMMSMTAVLLFSLDPTLALVTLLPFPLIAWLVHRVRGVLRRSNHGGSRAWAEMTSVLADTIPGIRVVKAFAQEKREVERFRHSNVRVLQANDRVNTTWSFFGPVVTLLTQSGLLLIWAFGAWEVFERRIEVGVLVGFQLLIGRFYVRLESMSRMVQATQRAATSSLRLFEIIDRTPQVAEPLRPVPIERLRGEIELRNVEFRHGNRPILHDLNLRIKPGEMIGLVGPSGAGKTTLVNLVCRFYDPAEGSILVDGVDLRSYSVNDYRKHVGLVLQEPFLFFGTVAENIAYGRPEATRDQIIAAARAARCHEFILRLPDGYDSIVGERGQSLSGGERQRISIARALLIDPRILILDEATSSVDTQVEREIQEALDNLIRGRTTIAIAHRLSTLRKADRLVVLERGRIAEIGGHHELLRSPGAYARLHNAQAQLSMETTP